MDAQQLLDNAFRKAREAAQAVYKKSQQKGLKRIKETEITRIKVVRDYLTSKLNKIVEEFPRVEKMPMFYVELLDATIGVKKFKQTMAKFYNASQFIDRLFEQYKNKIKGAGNKELIRKARNAFYGRVSSIVEELPFYELEKIRKAFEDFPKFKESLLNVVIAGFPNVGKSTLLNKLTNNRVDVKPYPFTTKKILVGLIKTPYGRVQIIDTPGVLDRPFEKLNPIEKKAILALRYLADEVIYVFDLTESCGYPLEKQIKLFEEIRRNFKEPIVYFSKTDLFEEKHWEELKKLVEKLGIKTYFTDSDKLKQYLVELGVKRLREKLSQRTSTSQLS